MIRARLAAVALVVALGASITPASASTAEAWAAFRTPYVIMVGDFGTVSYGIAIVYSAAPSGGTVGARVPPQHLVCVYKKAETSAATTVELSDFVPPY
jgi:hypothetical protein